MHSKLYSSEPSALCGNNFELIKNSLKAKKGLMMVPTDNDHKRAKYNVSDGTIGQEVPGIIVVFSLS